MTLAQRHLQIEKKPIKASRTRRQLQVNFHLRRKSLLRKQQYKQDYLTTFSVLESFQVPSRSLQRPTYFPNCKSFVKATYLKDLSR